MLKVIIFTIMIISFMLIFEKVVIISKACWNRIKPYVNSIIAKRKKKVQEKVQEKEKDNLKKRFEAKGWRVAK